MMAPVGPNLPPRKPSPQLHDNPLLRGLSNLLTDEQASCSGAGLALHLSNERMIVILAVGALAGWLIGKVLRGNGFGLVGDAAIGIVGALIGDWLLPRFNFHLWSGLTGIRSLNRRSGRSSSWVVLRTVGASGWGGGR